MITVKRTKPTHNPDHIVKNLEIFNERWCGVSHDNKYVFSESTKVEIENLKVHARKGCLSDIDVVVEVIGMKPFTGM